MAARAPDQPGPCECRHGRHPPPGRRTGQNGRCDKCRECDNCRKALDSRLVPADVGEVVSVPTQESGVREETAAQGSFLRRHGCHLAQGFFFSRPVEPAEVEEVVRGERGLSAPAHAAAR